MNSVVKHLQYDAPPVCEREIYRYAACPSPDESVKALLDECLKEAETVLTYHVCYTELPVKIDGDVCDFEAFSVTSASLSKHLSSCSRVLLFAATVGTPIDRLIMRYSRLSPAKAVMLQAIGTERIEALCDRFCREQAGGNRRFSPGYGDVPLSVQHDVFRVLNCEKTMGLCLNDSLLMSPSKSVTAFVPLSDTPVSKLMTHSCEHCSKHDCLFRGDV